MVEYYICMVSIDNLHWSFFATTGVAYSGPAGPFVFNAICDDSCCHNIISRNELPRVGLNVYKNLCT